MFPAKHTESGTKDEVNCIVVSYKKKEKELGRCIRNEMIDFSQSNSFLLLNENNWQSSNRQLWKPLISKRDWSVQYVLSLCSIVSFLVSVNFQPDTAQSNLRGEASVEGLPASGWSVDMSVRNWFYYLFVETGSSHCGPGLCKKRNQDDSASQSESKSAISVPPLFLSHDPALTSCSGRLQP